MNTGISQQLCQLFTHTLPRRAFLYFALTYEGKFDFSLVRQAASVIRPRLRIDDEFWTVEPYGRGEIVGMQNLVTRHSSILEMPTKEVVLDETQLGSWVRILDLICRLNRKKFTGIHRALSYYESLPDLRPKSDLRFLALFMIIEMLLTHDPVGEGDSLRRQVATKFPLVNSRLDSPLDFSAFSPASAEKHWKALYDYRSAVAHGSVADFSKGPLTVLKSERVAIEFVEEAVASLLQFALTDPVLLEHLKPV